MVYEPFPPKLILPEEDGLPLAQVVLAWLGVAAAQPLARGGVWLNRRRAAPTDPVQSGDTLSVRSPPDDEYREVELGPDDILYEDRWVLALNKRAGWYTGATPWDTQGNALAALGRFLAQRDGLGPYLHLAHQLDRDTSGVLLFSRDPLANKPLQRAFAERIARKEYLCVCAGTPPLGVFSVETGHGRGAAGGWRVYPLDEVGALLPNGDTVKPAQTTFRALCSQDSTTLLLVTPRTGRTHQIRLHLAHIGHPILGDIRYGGPTDIYGRSLPFHLLHAAALALPHPHTGEPLAIAAPLPYPQPWAGLGLLV